ncbi:MAG: tRNA guanosine(34) transglycosylase Tgt [Bacteroidales bacterium]|nr:tRNA guanosine(34) transglycosylase Tgt [Bacteroidales bacterium]
MKFNLIQKENHSDARAGEITTDHGKINTPVFMPVGTLGTVKGVNPRELKEEVQSSMLLTNTYHLFLRPGTEILQSAGGIHNFINWDLPVLSDSGGYQVFSLSQNRKLTKEGAHFQSHIDGSRHLFTPENVVDIQRAIGADLIMAFDECTPYPCDYKPARESMELTHHWLDRGVARFKGTTPIYGYEQSFFPIVQGSVYKDLRKESARFISDTDMEGYAIGGLSVGEPVNLMYEMVEVVNEILPADRPRYLMGVGTPENILESIHRGIDMFDCVIPTRNGRNGMLFTKNGIINIKNLKWKNDFSPIEEGGESYVDHFFSKAYLRHLTIAKEITAAQIATLHNLSFYKWLVNRAREQILNGSFNTWKKEMTEKIGVRL